MGEKKSKASAPTPSESTVESSPTTKTVSTSMTGFAAQARKNGILGPLDCKPPVNLVDIRERHIRSRGTPSPTESMYQNYVEGITTAPNEMGVTVEVGRQLLKSYPGERYNQAFNKAFTGFPKNAGVNNGLSAPQPDFVEGLGVDEFRPLPIEDCVDGAVLYKDNPDSITLPHLAGEFKGPGKNMMHAKLQSAYDGAALVHGRNRALDSLGEPSTAGHAKVTTFTTDGTNLNLFAHYATPSEDGATKYHQYPINSTILTNSLQDFRQGYRQIRNAQDYAREESYKLRDQLKEDWKAKRSQPAPLPSIEDEPSRPRHSKASRSSKGE
ncbi:hypothetical protein CDV36_011388 [Fusarium kuroshium]|uniref:DUF7924 domain-containing protein n=4 Tax=Fusarium solani species complex TaxID=232080 RepID=A0A3M2RUL9_9HYPO|nr:hypothetical protein CDV36_011388 [Fusarium kuroshium]RSL60969.1 hypothetical protein CEP51_013690 [Fusarium floridanum]RSL93212.1 hypothetical protein CEP52_013360 [Fusarium oligoseptatum]RSL95961.1 hypothetical protein CDV31_013659 [Fusarium ambrosium]